MKSAIADYYREINRDFLDKAWQDGPQIGFELFYKTTNGGEQPLFLKFGSYDPDTREKICKLVASGDKIAFPSQVSAISDVFNALICKREHRDPRSAFETLVEMKNNMPGHFDPKILFNFIKAFARSQQ